ncbi:FMN-binding glutamate synthase family protein [Streptomyces sp. ID05-04B]|uniref:FMN-binding glutamate synthase family protein n=1 Tax=unclassified Streptomyces TaxID=2593676 RepID=UPI000D1C044D|nr:MULTISPECIES: FMN-binding glutamate synthase family protein [unclassified Streptomyces]AVV46862.1 FMN-binding glutamate synthase family protein [Streptomyces sp. P3]MDX5563832.1 FMN-binding glutamate synthase family protein [Streptomyces sp. ID05-04B]
MRRFLPLLLVALCAAVATAAAAALSARWWFAAAPLLATACLGLRDLLQRGRSVPRNHPLVGRLRYPTARALPRGPGPERPVDASGEPDGHEYLVPSLRPVEAAQEPPSVRVGGPDCSQPYDMALLNVSAMSFGALSSRAVLALNRGAALGRFAQDTGEGGLSEHHLRGGGDLVWEIGTGYFGCRTADGGFDERVFADKAALPEVRCVSLKLSQGAAPGSGSVLPGAKVGVEIARERDVPVGEPVVSPPVHRTFATPRELVLFVARLRELAGGKPTGFKLCVGSRREFLAVCRAMAAEGVTPDFVVVDGSEGGTGAAPAEFAGRLGMPLTQGLITVHNALAGVGLRDRVRIGASGRVASGSDIVRRLVQGADYTNAARAMMLALGCVRAGRCHTGACPAGVATQDPLRTRALQVADKARQVRRYQRETVRDAMRIMAAMGVREPGGLTPAQLVRRTGPGTERSYAELYEWLAPGELLAGAPESWAADWKAADPDSFG